MVVLQSTLPDDKSSESIPRLRFITKTNPRPASTITPGRSWNPLAAGCIFPFDSAAAIDPAVQIKTATSMVVSNERFSLNSALGKVSVEVNQIFGTPSLVGRFLLGTCP
jgi:hypothetical protein